MRFSGPLIGALALLVSSGRAAPATDLLNDRDLTGWELVAPPPADLATACTVQPDGVVAVTGQPLGFLATVATFANYRLHAEWRWPGKPGNGGVLVHISSGPKDRVWPLCFQVQAKHQSAGDLLPMAGATFAEPLTTAMVLGCAVILLGTALATGVLRPPRSEPLRP